MEQRRIRNFCIIAHIDHGKSTLADRLLEDTGTIESRVRVEQVLDQMDLERERGITIKAQAVQMFYRAKDGVEYELNLIDTPGHVDFTYEVSRSLAACEGALIVVDASQGIQAQTLAHMYAALEHDLTLIPVVNKIDLPNAYPEDTAEEIRRVLGLPLEDIIYASAKEGVGTDEILEAIVQRIPPPSGAHEAPLRALIFDSKYDSYKGVIAYVRIMDGVLAEGQRVQLMISRAVSEVLEVGVFRPQFSPVPRLEAGEVGYIATGLKRVQDCRVGDTLTLADRPATTPLPGYLQPKAMVFAGLYPSETNDYDLLRDALEKLQLNDAALQFQPENSLALGFGFRCGFLGLLHMDVVQERLEREYGIDLLVTAPSVECRAIGFDDSVTLVNSPADLPPPHQVQAIEEPWMSISVIVPSQYIGTIMDLVTNRRGEYTRMEYIDVAHSGAGGAERQQRVLLEYRLPLAEMLGDFYDQLKSRTQGYGSLDYSFLEYRPGDLVKLDILVNNQPVDALSAIVHQEKAFAYGRALVTQLHKLIPRQLFDVPVQAAVGSRVISRETIRALRKNVLAKCYGGDITRKRKLLEKQAEGKKRLKRLGSVEIPQEAFMAVLRIRE